MGLFGSNDKTTTQTPYGSQYIDFGNQQAQGLYNKGIKNPPTLAPLNRYSEAALKNTATMASRDVPGLSDAFNFNSNLLNNNGMTSGMQETAGYLTPFANGSMQEDPRLQQMLDYNTDQAANATATRMGGGRYGSAAIGNAFGSAIGAANNSTMLQANENSRNRQLQASGLLGNLYQQGVGNAMQASAMIPSLNNLRYDGMSRLAGVGDFFQDRAQTQADMTRNNGWDQLGKYNAIVQGNGALGRSTTTPGPSAAQSILGGAATGGALLGPWGAVAGGLLGAFG